MGSSAAGGPQALVSQGLAAIAFFAESCKCACIGFHSSLFKVKLLEAVPKDACGQTLRGGYL